jgi:excisionase family DNA binding protein
MIDQLLFTVSDAADRLSLSRSKVYELLAQGTLRSVTVGRSRRIPADALVTFVAALSADDSTS